MKAESSYITYLLVILPRSKEAMTEAQICLTVKVCFSVCPMLPPKAENMKVEKWHLLVKYIFLLAWFTHFQNTRI